jgi:hypothetical protein
MGRGWVGVGLHAGGVPPWTAPFMLYTLVSAWVSFSCGQEGGSEEGRCKVGASNRMKGKNESKLVIFFEETQTAI